MNPYSIRCCGCLRDSVKIAKDAKTHKRVSHKAVLEVLYKDKDNNLVCPRCVSEYDVTVDFGAKPVVTYKPRSQRFSFAEKIVREANQEPFEYNEDDFMYY